MRIEADNGRYPLIPKHAVRITAAASIVRLAAGDTAVRSVLLDALDSDNPDTRTFAITALRDAEPTPKVLKRVRTALNDDDERVRKQAREALRIFGDSTTDTE